MSNENSGSNVVVQEPEDTLQDSWPAAVLLRPAGHTELLVDSGSGGLELEVAVITDDVTLDMEQRV